MTTNPPPIHRSAAASKLMALAAFLARSRERMDPAKVQGLERELQRIAGGIIGKGCGAPHVRVSGARLKVYGGTLFAAGKQWRAIVAATSQAAAGAAAGVGVGAFRNQWSQSGNAAELERALASPGQVFVAPLDRAFGTESGYQVLEDVKEAHAKLPPHGWTAKEAADFSAYAAAILEREQQAKGEKT